MRADQNQASESCIAFLFCHELSVYLQVQAMVAIMLLLLKKLFIQSNLIVFILGNSSDKLLGY